MIKLHSKVSLIAILGTLVIGMLDNLKLGMGPQVRRSLCEKRANILGYHVLVANGK